MLADRTDYMQPLKLISSNGTLLGTFTVPPDRYRRLVDLPSYGVFEFVYVCAPMQHSFVPSSPAEDPSPTVLYNRVAIARANIPGWCYDPAAFTIHGITPEELEKLPGHTFAPSAAYIRSLLEGQ